MGLIIFLIDFAFSLVRYMVIAGVVLYIAGHALHAWWLEHPVAQALIRFSQAVCYPFRKLMEALGIPTRPLDFSPVAALVFLRIVQWIVVLLLRWFY